MMKSFLFSSLFALLFFSGCATVPVTPKANPEKYILQIVSIDSLGEFLHPSELTSKQIKQRLKTSEDSLAELPLVYARMGEPQPLELGDTQSIKITLNQLMGNQISYEMTHYGTSQKQEITTLEQPTKAWASIDLLQNSGPNEKSTPPPFFFIRILPPKRILFEPIAPLDDSWNHF